MIEFMRPKWTLTRCEIQGGDIVCFRIDTNQEAHDFKSQGLYPDPPQFYDFLQNRVRVLFRPKFDEPGADQPEFSLVLNKKQNYDAVGYHFFVNSVVTRSNFFRWPLRSEIASNTNR